jgi:hypothetical protein
MVLFSLVSWCSLCEIWLFLLLYLIFFFMSFPAGRDWQSQRFRRYLNFLLIFSSFFLHFLCSRRSSCPSCSSWFKLTAVRPRRAGKVSDFPFVVNYIRLIRGLLPFPCLSTQDRLQHAMAEQP